MVGYFQNGHGVFIQSFFVKYALRTSFLNSELEYCRDNYGVTNATPILHIKLSVVGPYCTPNLNEKTLIQSRCSIVFSKSI